uniref:Uncharacterized protein n=1 Tax=Cucumis melo TaxID=3656 RepID=A0A9I9E8T1_CUCME
MSIKKDLVPKQAASSLRPSSDKTSSILLVSIEFAKSSTNKESLILMTGDYDYPGTQSPNLIENFPMGESNRKQATSALA